MRVVSGIGRRIAICSLLVASAVALVVSEGAAAETPAPSPNVSVFATGLNNPRGLTFGPDGDLYVAEGGLGGTMTTTPAQCTQVPAPVGPYSGGHTGRISKISPTGARSTVADGLPSSQTSPALGGLVSGVADVKFVHNTLFALTSGAGCSHGLLGTANAVLRVNPDGSTTQVADLSAFQNANPVAKPEEDDFEPDGTWYSMAVSHGDLFAVEPNHGEIDRISPDTGTVSRVVDVSATQGHIVPTAIATRHGKLFFGNLGTFPVVPGTQSIFRVSRQGELRRRVGGLTTVLGLAFDHHGALYALESMTAPGEPGPAQLGSGRIVRITRSHGPETIASGLSFPTAMTFGPDDALYVSNMGFGGPAPGLGQILRVAVPHHHHHHHHGR